MTPVDHSWAHDVPGSNTLNRKPADIRIGLSDLHNGKGACPSARAAKVSLRVPDRSEVRDGAFSDFTLGPLMASLDRLEFGSAGPEKIIEDLTRTREDFRYQGKLVHPGLIDWTIEAFQNYVTAWDAHQERPGPRCPVSVPGKWVVHDELACPDRRGLECYERTCWGRQYRSEDGSVREIWLISFGEPKDKSEAQLALGAYVAVHGQPRAARSPADTVRPRQVRLVGFGGASGKTRVREWLGDDVDHAFEKHAKRALGEVIDATARVPGGDCVDCQLLSNCGSVVRKRLLPSLVTTHKQLRTISATDLRYYQSCPKRFHLVRELNLRDPDSTEGARITIGRAVDTLLNERHAADHAVRCGLEDSQEPASAGLVDEQRDIAGRMLAQHMAVCPLSSALDQSPQVQRTVSVYDEELGIVFVGTPDLMYRQAGRWVWRETKTSAWPLRAGGSLLRRHPQLALGVLFLAMGAVDQQAPGGRVELEHLQTDDLSLEEVDANRPEVVREAQDVIAELLAPLLEDNTFDATPGSDCGTCEVLRWCSDGRAHVQNVSDAIKQAGVTLID